MANFEQSGLQTKQFGEWLQQWRYGAVDWAEGELEFKFPMIDKWCYPYSCSICKRGDNCGVSLFKCKNCKMAHYCSREHQTQAWSNHKLVCKHLTNLFSSNFRNVNPTQIIPHDSKSWLEHLQMGLWDIRQLAGSKDPFKAQSNMDEWMNQRHCCVCFANPLTTTSTDTLTLIECKTCHCSAHCSSPACTEKFLEKHTKMACEQYFVGFASIIMAMQQGTILIIPSASRVPSYNLPGNWVDYFKTKLSDFEVPSQLLVLPPVMAMLTDGLSLPLTILRSLFLSYPHRELSGMSRIEVHVLGADAHELYSAESKFEEILHWLPSCKELVMVFVSPTVPGENSSLSRTLCASCVAARCSVRITLISGFYHDVVEVTARTAGESNAGDSISSNTTADVPSSAVGKKKTKQSLSTGNVQLVIACHSGMHDENGSPGGKPTKFRTTWEPTVRLLSQTDIPCVFTGYNADEIVQDRELLLSWGAKVVVEAHENPFRGLRPFPEIGRDNEFYYTNHSCIITRGSPSAV